VNKFLLFLIFLTAGSVAKAQKIDSIYFHLYTDSLKKGQHNYINVDGKLSNGNWQPLSAKEIDFSCTAATFNGNELIIPANFGAPKVTVKAVLRSNPSVWKEVTIWIKKLPDPALPTQDEIMNRPRKNKGRN